MLLLGCANLAQATARALAECSSSSPGDSKTAECQAWCSTTEAKFDCNFCMCKGCEFCGGTLTSGTTSAASGAVTGTTGGSTTVTCPLGVSVEVIKAWGGSGRGDAAVGGFRLEVVVNDWKHDALITFEFKSPAPTINAVFAADLVSEAKEITGSGLRGKATFKLRTQWDEKHGFGFTGRGSYPGADVSCTVLDPGPAMHHHHVQSPPPPPYITPSPPLPPPPPGAPSPPPYPPLTERQKNPASEAACGTLRMFVDRKWEGGASLTVGVDPWRPGLPIHVHLNTPSTLGTVFHADTYADSPKLMTFNTANRPGQIGLYADHSPALPCPPSPFLPKPLCPATHLSPRSRYAAGNSVANNVGFQINLKGAYSGAHLSCNSHCAGAKVTLSYYSLPPTATYCHSLLLPLGSLTTSNYLLTNPLTPD